MKILSMIVPAYNSERFLDTCIASFLNESVLEKLDIIIVNDGSTDQTQDIAQSYCEKYPDSIRVISQENKGHGGALNTGCAAARGKYLKVIDADDWVQKQNLPEFVSALEKIDDDVVLTHYKTHDISTGEVKNWKSYPASFDRSYSMSEIMAYQKDFERGFTLHGITYRTRFYTQNGIQLSERVFYEDYEFSSIPACFAQSIRALDLFIYDYRIGDVAQSVSDESKLRRISHTQTVLTRLISEYPNAQNDAQRAFLSMKAKELLLSYITTVMLVEPCRANGRKLGGRMMDLFRVQMPQAYALARKQYRVFYAMNCLHITKKTWDRVLHSRLYAKIRHAHAFD